MKARWLVAKYMPDLRRREPDNVGVILLMDGRAHLRFLGQRDGRVDGRSVRWAGSVKNYKAWALVNPRENDKDLDRQLCLLREHGKVVDVSNEIIAADNLRELLHLAPGTSTT